MTSNVVREALLAVFTKLRMHGHICLYGDTQKWTVEDLAAELAPHLADELNRRQPWAVAVSEPEQRRVFAKTQMPCGCPVGSHPPGPCGLTGVGQEV